MHRSKSLAITLARKIARTTWATIAKGERYKRPAARGVNEIAPDNQRDVKVWRTNSTSAEPIDWAFRRAHHSRKTCEARNATNLSGDNQAIIPIVTVEIDAHFTK